MNKLLKELGLEPNATEEDALEALSKLRTEEKEPSLPEEVREAAGAEENATPAEVAASIATMRDKLSTLEAGSVPKNKLEEVEGRLKEAEDKLALTEATADVENLIGVKLTAAQREPFLKMRLADKKLFDETVKVMPELSLMQKAVPEGEPKKDSRPINPEILKRSSLSPEDIKKYGGD